MPQYNPYYDPWAKVGQSLTDATFKSLMSQPNPQEQAMMQAEIEAKRAQANNYRLKSQEVQNRIDAPKNMSTIFKDIFDPGGSVEIEDLTDDSLSMPAQPKVELTPDVINSRYQQHLPDLFTNAMQYGAENPGQLGDIFLAYAANAGANPQQISNAQLGAGMDYGKTREGTTETPFTLSPGAIRYDGQGNQIASAPFKPAGKAGSFTTTLPDGTTIQYGGIEPTKTTTNNIQGNQVQNAKLRNLINYTRDLAKKDTGNFGFPGFVKGTVQDVSSLLGGISQSMGYTDNKSAILDAQQQIADNGVDPSLLNGIFDPNLPALQTASDLLVFQAASALAGQKGRSVSDRDVKMFKDIVGDPRSVFSNQEKFLSKLNTVENMLQMNEKVDNTTLQGNVTGNASGTKTLPDVGFIDNGYRYTGGDPNDRNNWEQVQ